MTTLCLPASEDVTHRAVWAHYQQRRTKGSWMCHIPNGEARTAVTGAKLKSMGVVAGVPDFLVIRDGEVMWLEIKARGGRISDAQKSTIRELERVGTPVAVAFGLDAALRQLEEWGVIR